MLRPSSASTRQWHNAENTAIRESTVRTRENMFYSLVRLTGILGYLAWVRIADLGVTISNADGWDGHGLITVAPWI